MMPPRTTLRRSFVFSLGPIGNLAVGAGIPLVAFWLLPTGDYAFAALLLVMAATGTMVDFGGTALVSSLLPMNTYAPRRVLYTGSTLTLLGSTVVGIVAVLAWWGGVGASFAGTGWEGARGSLALVGMSAGAALRSAALVISSAAITWEDARLRNWSSGGVSLLYGLCACALLLVSPSVWSLVAAFVGSSLLGLCWSAQAARRRTVPSSAPDAANPESLTWQDVRPFALGKSLTSILTVTLVQADRWILAAVLGPAAVATYDLALRFAQLPKTLLLALSQTVTADVARALRTPGSDTASNIRKTFVQLAALSIVPTLFLGLIALQVSQTFTTDTLAVYLFYFAAQSLHALTAFTTMTWTAHGQPQREVGYLVLAVILTGLLWLIGALTSSPIALIYASGLGLVIGSTYLLMVQSRRPLS